MCIVCSCQLILSAHSSGTDSSVTALTIHSHYCRRTAEYFFAMVTTRARRSPSGGAVEVRGTTTSPPIDATAALTKSVSRSASRSASKAAAASLASFHDLHADSEWHFLADNPAIHTGYRHRLTCVEALLSLFSLHNESVNVWSHLSGALLFLTVLSRLIVSGVPSALIGFLTLDDGRPATHPPLAGDAAVPTWPIAVFLVSAITCLGASAAFHLLHVTSRFWYTALSSLDYASISVLIAGSSVPPIYYGFWCAKQTGWCYIAACVALGCISTALGVTPKFRTPPFRIVRMSCFIGTGSFGVIPLVHLLLSTHNQYGEVLEGMVLMGALYLFGALLYGFRVPERFLPGRLDYGGTSHNVRTLQQQHRNYYFLCHPGSWNSPPLECDDEPSLCCACDMSFCSHGCGISPNRRKYCILTTVVPHDYVLCVHVLLLASP